MPGHCNAFLIRSHDKVNVGYLMLQVGQRLGNSIARKKIFAKIVASSYSKMSDRVDASGLRLSYLDRSRLFLEENIKVFEPIRLFNDWFKEALKSESVVEGNAACLATVGKNGCPSNRFVLVKEVTSKGFTFFTNYESRKAHDILENPNVALTFYWVALRRSVRIEGVAEKMSPEESLGYFRQRPRASQIGALASRQSSKIESRTKLDEIEAKLKAELEGKEVPLPNWGGYLVRPHTIEFWQGQVDRLHDRIRFRKESTLTEKLDERYTHRGEDGWVYERLQP